MFLKVKIRIKCLTNITTGVWNGKKVVAASAHSSPINYSSTIKLHIIKHFKSYNRKNKTVFSSRLLFICEEHLSFLNFKLSNKYWRSWHRRYSFFGFYSFTRSPFLFFVFTWSGSFADSATLFPGSLFTSITWQFIFSFTPCLVISSLVSTTKLTRCGLRDVLVWGGFLTLRIVLPHPQIAFSFPPDQIVCVQQQTEGPSLGENWKSFC